MQQTTRSDTKAALIRAAERLFAEKGLGTVSVKDITLAAGARNPSAVHYHFGNIEALIREVFEHRYMSIEQARLDQLDRIEASGASGTITMLMEAAVRPLFEACLEEDGRLYARFSLQLSTDPRFDVVQLVQDLGINSATRIRDHILAQLSDVPEALLRARLRHLIPITLVQTAGFAQQVEAGAVQDIEAAIQDAAVCLAGFVTAPPA